MSPGIYLHNSKHSRVFSFYYFNFARFVRIVSTSFVERVKRPQQTFGLILNNKWRIKMGYPWPRVGLSLIKVFKLNSHSQIPGEEYHYWTDPHTFKKKVLIILLLNCVGLKKKIVSLLQFWTAPFLSKSTMNNKSKK